MSTAIADRRCWRGPKFEDWPSELAAGFDGAQVGNAKKRNSRPARRVRLLSATVPVFHSRPGRSLGHPRPPTRREQFTSVMSSIGALAELRLRVLVIDAVAMRHVGPGRLDRSAASRGDANGVRCLRSSGSSAIVGLSAVFWLADHATPFWTKLV